MNTARINCDLLEPNGTRLAGARCRLMPGDANWTARMTGFDSPGRIVQRCLLDNLTEVWIRAEGGLICPGHIDSVSFEPALGRVCSIRIEAAAGVMLARALIDPAPARPAAVAAPVKRQAGVFAA